MLNTLLCYLLICKQSAKLGSFTYVNPLVLTASLGLFLFFVNLKMKPSRFVNWVAESAFAVYLLHLNYYTSGPFFKIVKTVYAQYSSLAYLGMIFAVLVVIFVVAVIVDQPRKWVWRYVLVNRIFPIKKKQNEITPLKQS